MAIKKPNLSNIYSTQADAANRDNKIAEDQLLPEYWDDIEYKDMGDGTYLLYKEGENGEEIGMGWTNDDGFEVPAVESVNEIVSALDKAKAEYTDLHDSNQMSDEAYAEKMNEISIKLEKISDYTDLRDSGQMTDEQLAEKVKEIYNSKGISVVDALKDVASSGANLAVEGANIGHEAAVQAKDNASNIPSMTAYEQLGVAERNSAGDIIRVDFKTNEDGSLNTNPFRAEYKGNMSAIYEYDTDHSYKVYYEEGGQSYLDTYTRQNGNWRQFAHTPIKAEALSNKNRQVNQNL